MRIRIIAFLLLLFPSIAFAQSPVVNDGTFSLTANAIALPNGKETVAGTLLGQSKSVTNTVSLRATELLAPDLNTQGYYGGFVWFPSKFQSLLAKTKLSGLVPYVTASAGMEIFSPPNLPSQRHVSIMAGGGVNSCATSNSVKVCVNLVEAQFVRLPNVAGSTAVIASGLKLTF